MLKGVHYHGATACEIEISVHCRHARMECPEGLKTGLNSAQINQTIGASRASAFPVNDEQLYNLQCLVKYVHLPKSPLIINCGCLHSSRWHWTLGLLYHTPLDQGIIWWAPLNMDHYGSLWNRHANTRSIRNGGLTNIQLHLHIY